VNFVVAILFSHLVASKHSMGLGLCENGLAVSMYGEVG